MSWWWLWATWIQPRRGEHVPEVVEVGGVRLVRADVLGGDHRVEGDGQAPAGERDQIPVAVGEQGQPPAVVAARRERVPDIGEDRPVREGDGQGAGVVPVQGQREVDRRPAQPLGQDLAIAGCRGPSLDLQLVGEIRIAHLVAAPREEQVPR